ncbi:MAG: IS66 family transposase [Pseudonocardiaceae bacterium]
MHYLLPQRHCGCCRRTTTAAPPLGAAGTVVFGPNVNAAAILLASEGNVPIERTAALMAMMLSSPVSTGFVARSLQRFAQRLAKAGFDDAMTTALRAEPVLCSDETPTNVISKNTDAHRAPVPGEANRVWTFTRNLTVPRLEAVAPPEPDSSAARPEHWPHSTGSTRLTPPWIAPPQHGTGPNPTSWTASAECAPSADPASSTTTPPPSPEVARPKRTTPSDSPSTHWTLTPPHQPRTATSPQRPALKSALALARVCQGHVDGAAEALRPVLDLPPSQRINKIVTAVQRVRTALSAVTEPGRDAIDLAGAIEGWTTELLTLPE